jgi:hypothetical protein
VYRQSVGIDIVDSWYEKSVVIHMVDAFLTLLYRKSVGKSYGGQLV